MKKLRTVNTKKFNWSADSATTRWRQIFGRQFCATRAMDRTDGDSEANLVSEKRVEDVDYHTE